MTQPITRITRKLHSWPVTATLAGSDTPAGITAVTVAFLRPDTNPTGSTVFTAAAWNNGYATVLIAGEDADPTGATVLTAGQWVPWFRVDDTPEVDAQQGPRINVL